MKAVSNPGKFEADVEDWKNSKKIYPTLYSCF